MNVRVANMQIIFIFLAIVNLSTANSNRPVLIESAASLKNQPHSFPKDFSFGAATAAYQIEGAYQADGKGPSIWDSLTHNHPELVVDHSTGDIAADSYHFYKKDVAALKEVGVRFA